MAFDGAAAVALLVGLLALRSVRPPVIKDVGEAFQILDRTIERFVPGLPIGFTWGEAMERLKGYGVEVDWPKMETTLAGYEAFRYGGREMPQGTGQEAILLSPQIRRKLIGRWSKAKGTFGDRLGRHRAGAGGRTPPHLLPRGWTRPP